jgi:hypothetical protein
MYWCSVIFGMNYREGDEFLEDVVTGDESLVSHCAPWSKQQSQEWYRVHSDKDTMKLEADTSHCRNHGHWFFRQEGHSFD